MPSRHTGQAASAEGLRLAAALREYKFTTGITQEQIADRHGVRQQTVGSWMNTGRMQPRFVPAIKQMLTEAGIEYETVEVQPPSGYVHLHELARAAMLLRVGGGPELNEREASIFRDLDTELSEGGVAVASLLVRLANGPPLGEADEAIFRRTFNMRPETEG